MCIFFYFFFFFNDTATTEIYTRKDTLSLHDALPISTPSSSSAPRARWPRPSARPRSEEHTSELQSPFLISYAVFCLKKKKKKKHKRYILSRLKKRIIGHTIY